MQEETSDHSGSFLPLYWEDAKKELMNNDRIMHKLIPQFGNLCLVKKGTPFPTLAYSIINQQIPTKSVESIWKKFLIVCPKTNPTEIL